VPKPNFLLVTDPPVAPLLDGLPTATADRYLGGEGGTLDEGLVVVNLCRSYQYLSKGYYVSLVAEARRQRALPSLGMIEEINNPFAYLRALQEAGVKTIDFKIQHGRRAIPKVIVVGGREGEPVREGGAGTRSTALVSRQDPKAGLRFERTDRGYLDVTAVFGRSAEERFRRLCGGVFRVYSFPLLKVRMYEVEDGWRVGQIYPATIHQMRGEELALLAEQLARRPFLEAPPAAVQVKPHRLACLVDPDDSTAPSDEDTLDKFARIAARRGVLVEKIRQGDLGRLGEFDALFIRTVTNIDHYSFHFAQAAESLGIPVIDDTASILKCSNKIFLYELFRKHELPTPQTAVVSPKRLVEDVRPLGFPVILKLPDGTFSKSVKMARDEAELEATAREMFKRSPLLIAQKFTPSPFDWRVGILGGRVLWVAKYHMAKDHWQIARHSKSGYTRYGRTEAVPIAEAPEAVVAVAQAGAALIGDGLYGVDVKETESGPVIIEINDNPNLEAGYEDAVEKDRPYEEILNFFQQRIEAESRPPRPAEAGEAPPQPPDPGGEVAAAPVEGGEVPAVPVEGGEVAVPARTAEATGEAASRPPGRDRA
jgi:glutathione synthase/RimK-type ligase-like ATP-grasp enzyme